MAAALIDHRAPRKDHQDSGGGRLIPSELHPVYWTLLIRIQDLGREGHVPEFLRSVSLGLFPAPSGVPVRDVRVEPGLNRSYESNVRPLWNPPFRCPNTCSIVALSRQAPLRLIARRMPGTSGPPARRPQHRRSGGAMLAIPCRAMTSPSSCRCRRGRAPAWQACGRASRLPYRP